WASRRRRWRTYFWDSADAWNTSTLGFAARIRSSNWHRIEHRLPPNGSSTREGEHRNRFQAPDLHVRAAATVTNKSTRACPSWSRWLLMTGIGRYILEHRDRLLEILHEHDEERF